MAMMRSEEVAFDIGTAMEELGQALKLVVRRGEYDEAVRFMLAAQQSITDAIAAASDGMSEPS